ncbi:MAG: hypothetical protein K1X52_14660 [Pyrinomonadaceae bacterium]|nr:hypothetical protein [Pyrinomonadaceae bacterium]
MSDSSPLDILIGETEQINPAILLAEEFMRRDAAELLSAEDIERAEKILLVGSNEIETIKRQEAAFGRSPANPSAVLPIGF